MSAIPKDIALRICEQIQEDRKKKIYSVGELQCIACLKSAKGDPNKMCFTGRLDNRGCEFINKRFDESRY